MKVAIVLIAALASAHAGIRVVRQSGWPAPTTSTTPGWSTPPPSPGWGKLKTLTLIYKHTPH